MEHQHHPGVAVERLEEHGEIEPRVNDQEFGGSGAKFKGLWRKKGVPRDALVQMKMKTGVFDATAIEPD